MRRAMRGYQCCWFRPRGTAEAESFSADGMTDARLVLGYRGARICAAIRFAMAAPIRRCSAARRAGVQAIDADLRGCAHPDRGARNRGRAARARLGLDYALNRKLSLVSQSCVPRVADKLAMSLVDFVTAPNELCRGAGEGQRQALRYQAGMASCSPRAAAWSNADASLQIHGGNGYALDMNQPLLCDARILNITKERGRNQAQVIARGLVERRNGMGTPRHPRWDGSLCPFAKNICFVSWLMPSANRHEAGIWRVKRRFGSAGRGRLFVKLDFDSRCSIHPGARRSDNYITCCLPRRLKLQHVYEHKIPNKSPG